MRPIDADALSEKLEGLMEKNAEMGKKSVADDYNFVLTVLLTAPTLGSMEKVVHCCDCVKRGMMACPMQEPYPWFSTNGDDFCSAGEREE